MKLLRWWPAPLLGLYGLFFLFCFHEADEDLWGRMAAGRLAAEKGRVPRQDVFAFVPTKPRWVDHEWLSGRVFYEVYRRWQGAGLATLNFALGMATVVLASAAARLRGGAAWSRALVLLAAWPLLAHGFSSLIRAQTFSFAFFALFLYLLERARGGSRRGLLFLFPASAAWANLHGGFVTGPLLVLIYAGCFFFASARENRASASSSVFSSGQQSRDGILLAALAVSCFGLTILNPYGFAYWGYLKEALLMPRPYIVEWRRLNLDGLADLHIKLGLLLAVLALAGGRKPRAEAALALAGTAAAAIFHVRFTPFLGLALAVFLPELLETIFVRGAASRGSGDSAAARPLRALRPLALMLCLEILILLGAAVSWPEARSSLSLEVSPDRYPVRAVGFIRDQGISGNLAVFFNWGEFAFYQLYPRCRVSFDGRLETVYPDEVIRANLDFTQGKTEGRRLIQNYPASLALYPPATGAARQLAAEARWERIYADGTAVVYRKLPES